LVTEKTTHQSTRSQRRHEGQDKPVGDAYSFEVNLWATKDEIKHAVEEMFGVIVQKVRTQNRQGKRRRFRFGAGRLSNWKKAIVTLRHDSPTIDIF
jgi:large subunit ribosomal protein L23